MSDESKTNAENAALTNDQEQNASETVEKAGKKFNRLSKKNKLITNGVKKIVGGLDRGGWDGNHNEVFI